MAARSRRDIPQASGELGAVVDPDRLRPRMWCGKCGASQLAVPAIGLTSVDQRHPRWKTGHRRPFETCAAIPPAEFRAGYSRQHTALTKSG